MDQLASSKVDSLKGGQGERTAGMPYQRIVVGSSFEAML